MGPHGGVLEAFATSGQTFELSKMSESRFSMDQRRRIL